MHLLFLAYLFLQSFQPSPYYRELGEDYENAFRTLKSMQLDEVAQQCGCNEQLVKAILFPEVIRYNGISNLLETSLMEALYVEEGSIAIDFSVGPGQIKPSFAEFIEIHSPKKLLLSPYKPDGETMRRERLERLQHFAWQFRYVCAFELYLAHRFPEQKSVFSEREWVAFSAAAYNLGPDSSLDDILEWIPVRAFPYGSKYGTDQFSYSELATHYFQSTL